MTDVIIVGAGPAGISASLYAARANLKVVVFNHGQTAMTKAKIENYYGFDEAIDGDVLFKKGIDGAKRLGVEVIDEEVVLIEYMGDQFIVKTPTQEAKAKALILAIGKKKIRPKVKNIEEFEGAGVSYCAVCDGYFFKDKTVGVIGSGEFALHEAKYLSALANVILFTNGEDLDSEFQTYTSKVIEVKGKNQLEEVVLEDGSTVSLDGLFVALGSAGVNDFANQLGLITSQNNFVVGLDQETNISGIFAAGDCTGGLAQIAKAVSDGAHAGIAVIKYIKSSTNK